MSTHWFTRVLRNDADIDVLFVGFVQPSPGTGAGGAAGARPVNVRTRLASTAARRALPLIARARVVLNLHFHLPGAFEIVRVGYLLANRCAVVYGVNPSETVDADLAGGFLARAPFSENCQP